jgi:hypothetical protein
MTSAITFLQQISRQPVIPDAGFTPPPCPEELVFGDPALEEFSMAARLPTPSLICWVAIAAWKAFCGFLVSRLEIG